MRSLRRAAASALLLLGCGAGGEPSDVAAGGASGVAGGGHGAIATGGNAGASAGTPAGPGAGGRGGAPPDPRPGAGGAAGTSVATPDAGARLDGPVGPPPPLSFPDGGQASPPAPWRGKDIGELSLMPGQSMSSPSSFYFKFGGKNIGGTADSFYFAYQTLKGDGQILVGRPMVTAAPMSKVGIMIRASLEPGAVHVLLTFPDETAGWNLQARKAAGATTEALKNVPYNKDFPWLRLVRKGNTITAIRSQGLSSNPSTVGTVDLPLPADALIGIAMENHGDSFPGTLDLSDVQVDNLAADPATAAWLHDDVLAVGGTAISAGGTFTVSGWGEPPTKDRLRFTMVARALAGPQTVTARLMGQTATVANARAGVIVRNAEVNTTGRRQGATSGAWVYATTTGGVVFETRSTKGGDPVKGGMAPDMKPPVWVRVESADLGGGMNKFTGSVSKDGQQWAVVGSATIPFVTTIPPSVGMFAGSGDYSMMNTATFDNVTVQPGP